MKRYQGGKTVPQGIYLHLATGEITQVHGEHQALPLRGEDYVKLPVMLAIVLGPFAGLLFVFFLPLVGIFGVIGMLVIKVWRDIRSPGARKQRENRGNPGPTRHVTGNGRMEMGPVEESIEEILEKRETRRKDERRL